MRAQVGAHELAEGRLAEHARERSEIVREHAVDPLEPGVGVDLEARAGRPLRVAAQQRRDLALPLSACPSG